MGGSASGSMGHMGNMGGLAACSVSDTKPMQFPLAQRRKRRVLFTQAQVGCQPNCYSFFIYFRSIYLYALCVCASRLFLQVTQLLLVISSRQLFSTDWRLLLNFHPLNFLFRTATASAAYKEKEHKYHDNTSNVSFVHRFLFSPAFWSDEFRRKFHPHLALFG